MARMERVCPPSRTECAVEVRREVIAAVLPVEVDRRGSVGWGVECQARLGEGGWRGGRGVRCIVFGGVGVCVSGSER